MSAALERWIEAEYRIAAAAMLRSISAVDLVKTRPGFGQSLRPAKGSVIASPVMAAYDPDPDYCFHWYRDSAVVMDALRLLSEDAGSGVDGAAMFEDYLRFSLSLRRLDGRVDAASPARRAKVAADYLQFLRDDDDLASAHGDAVIAQTRVNPDGTLDVSKWARPQHDGPPLTALSLLRWSRSVFADRDLDADLSSLLRWHLDFTHRHWREPSYDIWEEERGEHYYTLRVSAAALIEGADWLQARGEPDTARSYREQAQAIFRRLDDFWLGEQGHYRSRILSGGAPSTKDLDIAVILAAIHVDQRSGAHTVNDPRMQATLARLEDLFDARYPINRGRPAQRGPAMGRYATDVYYSGGAYYFSTLGAAEFCFCAAMGAADAQRWIARGDAYLETVRAFTPTSGELSEQFDQASGLQTSAKHLAWSYAAFISCIATRRVSLGAPRFS